MAKKTRAARLNRDCLRDIAKQNGLHQYNAGEAYICSTNIEHGDVRNTYNDKCFECTRNRSKKQYIDSKEYRSGYGARRYEENKERIKSASYKWKAENKERISRVNQEYYEANAEHVKSRVSEWKRDNPGMVADHNTKRRLAKHERTPSPQSDIEAFIINEIYKRCSNLLGYHVDHRIPLLHTSTPGNHSIYNLRIISESDNLRKSNKLDVDLDFIIDEIDISDLLFLCSEYVNASDEERHIRSLFTPIQET